MKKLVAIFLASLLTIYVVHANPLHYIQERGWKETEKTKEMNLKNFHVYQLNNYEAMLLWNALKAGDYTIKIGSKEEGYAIYTTDDIDEFNEVLKSIYQHQIPDVEWVFTKEEVINGTR